MRRVHDTEDGFTMIEMMIVMVVLAVLMSIAIFAVSALDDSASETVDEGNVKQCSSALAAYAVEHGTEASGWADIAPYFEPGATDPGCVY